MSNLKSKQAEILKDVQEQIRREQFQPATTQKGGNEAAKDYLQIPQFEYGSMEDTGEEQDKRGGDDDDDDDDIYTFQGIPIKTSNVQSDLKKANIAPTPKAMSLLPGVVLSPEQLVEKDEKELREIEKRRRIAQSLPAHTNITISPYMPTHDAEKTRNRSAMALAQARQKIFMETGRRPRLVRDEVTGTVLPFSEIVPTGGDFEGMGLSSQGPPVAINSGGITAAPNTSQLGQKLNSSSGAGGGNGWDVEEEEGSGATTHYKRSVDVLHEIRMKRLLRKLEEQ